MAVNRPENGQEWSDAGDRVIAVTMLASRDVRERITEVVDPGDQPPGPAYGFWRMMRDRIDMGEAVDVEALLALARLPEVEAFGGRAKILDLALLPVLVSSAPTHVHQLLELAITEAMFAELSRPQGPRTDRMTRLTERLAGIPALMSGTTGGQWISVSDIDPEEVSWLWRHRIPLGSLTIICGDAGLGKSLLTIELAARVTRGQMHVLPGQTDAERAEPATVAIITTEDSLAVTVRPRLEQAGADLTRVKVWSAGDGEDLTFPSGIGRLRQFCERERPRLLILDPLTGVIDSGIDSHKDQDIRRALKPLYGLAAEIGASITGISHLNKSTASGPWNYRVMGSVGIAAAAPSVLFFTRDPDEPEDSPARIVSLTKSNLGPPAKVVELTLAKRAESQVHPTVGWRGESERSIASILTTSEASNGKGRGGNLEEAEDFLREYLAEGARGTLAVESEAKNGGITEATLKRAKERIGARAFQQNRTWFWELPSGAQVNEPLRNEPALEPLRAPEPHPEVQS